jgi:hypothetical protein
MFEWLSSLLSEKFLTTNMKGTLSRVLHSRLGLSNKCNKRTGASKLCSQLAIRWYLLPTIEIVYNGALTEERNRFIAHARCGEHEYQSLNPKMTCFSSLEEIVVWRVMQS